MTQVTMIPKTVYTDLCDIVGKDYIATGPLATFAYTQDASIFGGTKSQMIIRPGTTEEVSLILSLVNEQGIPVVIRGGGASVLGQPRGEPGSNILFDMTRMNKLLSIDEKNMTMTVQAGIIMSKLQRECQKAGYYKRLPLPPIHIATLGGWLSAAGGGSGLVQETVGMTVVLPNGTVVSTGGGPGTNINQPSLFNRYLGGPDLTSLFMGDCGVFGVKTEITTRITHPPAAVRASAFVFRCLEDTLEMVDRYMERVDRQPFDPISVFCPATAKTFIPVSGDEEPYVVLGILYAQSLPEMDVKLEFFNSLAEQLGGTRNPVLDAMMSSLALVNLDSSEEEKNAREKADANWLSSLNALGLPALLSYTLPRNGFVECLKELYRFRNTGLEEARQKGYHWTSSFEAFTPIDPSTIYGDMAVFFPDTKNTELAEFINKFTRDYLEFGCKIGSIDTHKQGFMTNKFAKYWSPSYKELYQTIKYAVDPKNILNRDLWIPEDEEKKF